jgi:hypothetical protein
MNVPESTHSSTLNIMGVELVVHVLDDGRRIIEAEGLHQLIEAMSDGVELSEDEAAELARAVRGSLA